MKYVLLLVLIFCIRQNMLPYGYSSSMKRDVPSRKAVNLILNDKRMQEIFDDVFNKILLEEYKKAYLHKKYPLKDISNDEKMRLIFNKNLNSFIKEVVKDLDFHHFYSGLTSSEKKGYNQFIKNLFYKYDNIDSKGNGKNENLKNEKNNLNNTYPLLNEKNIDKYYQKFLNGTISKKNPNFSVKNYEYILRDYLICPDFSSPYTYTKDNNCYFRKNLKYGTILNKLTLKEECEQYFGCKFQDNECHIQNIYTPSNKIIQVTSENCYKYRYGQFFWIKDSNTCKIPKNISYKDCQFLSHLSQKNYIYHRSIKNCIDIRKKKKYQNEKNIVLKKSLKESIHFDFNEYIIKYVNEINSIFFVLEFDRIEMDEEENKDIWYMRYKKDDSSSKRYFKFSITQSDLKKRTYTEPPIMGEINITKITNTPSGKAIPKKILIPFEEKQE